VIGQLATDPDDDGLALPDGIEAQTRKVLDNLKRTLAAISAPYCGRLAAAGDGRGSATGGKPTFARALVSPGDPKRKRRLTSFEEEGRRRQSAFAHANVCSWRQSGTQLCGSD
jgi:hypothetical protein